MTIVFVIFIIVLAFSFKKQLDTTEDVARVVKESAAQVVQTCDEQALTRATVRQAMFLFLDTLEPVDALPIRTFIENDYPPIVCPSDVPAIEVTSVP